MNTIVGPRMHDNDLPEFSGVGFRTVWLVRYTRAGGDRWETVGMYSESEAVELAQLLEGSPDVGKVGLPDVGLVRCYKVVETVTEVAL